MKSIVILALLMLGSSCSEKVSQAVPTKTQEESNSLLIWSSSKQRIAISGRVDALGQKYEREFRLVNDLGVELEISEVWKSCTCAAATLSASRIPAGGEAALRLVADIDNLKQEFMVRLYGRTVSGSQAQPAFTLSFAIAAEPNAVICIPRVINVVEGTASDAVAVHVISQSKQVPALQCDAPDHLMAEISEQTNHKILEGISTSVFDLRVHLLEYQNAVEWITVRDVKSGASCQLKIGCSPTPSAERSEELKRVFAGTLMVAQFPYALISFGFDEAAARSFELISTSCAGLSVSGGMLYLSVPPLPSESLLFEVMLKQRVSGGGEVIHCLVGNIKTQ